MKNITLELTPLRSAFLAGHDNEMHVLVRARAAEAAADQAQRRPLNLALVLDRSGSMSGAPLREAIRCARFIVDSLHRDDHASIVVYDDTVDTLVSSRRVKNGRRFHRVLNNVVSGGCTALFDGWFEGAGQAASTAGDDAISRVLLLSDGCANRGLVNEAEVTPRCAEMAEAGVSTSTYGLGRNFNETLMGEMAKAGLGSCYYGQTAEDLMDPFRREFDLLSALCARRLRLAVDAPGAVEVQVLNGYSKDSRGRVILPDLASGADVWALLRVRVPAATVADQGTTRVPLLNVSLKLADLETGEQRALSGELNLPVLGETAFGAIAEDATVRARIQELRSAVFQDQIRAASLVGDWSRVDAVLGEAGEEARDNPWLAEGLQALRRYAESRDARATSKEAYYRSAKLRTRSTSSREMLDAFSEQDELSMPTFLRRKRTEGKRSKTDKSS